MDNFLHLSEDELLEIIGASIDPGELGMFPQIPDPKQLKERAETWLHENHTVLQDKICNKAEIISLGWSAEKELVFLTVFQVLAATLTGIDVGALTAYLVKHGINRFCASVK